MGSAKSRGSKTWATAACVWALAGCPELELDPMLNAPADAGQSGQGAEPQGDMERPATPANMPGSDADGGVAMREGDPPAMGEEMPPMGEQMAPMGEEMPPMGEAMPPPPDGGMPDAPRVCEGETTTLCCGDEVCDGPENHDNCASDCAEGEFGGPPPDGGMGAPVGPEPTTPRACDAMITTMCCGDQICGGPETAANCAADC